MIERLDDFLWCESVANPDSFSCVIVMQARLTGLASCHLDGCSLASQVIHKAIASRCNNDNIVITVENMGAVETRFRS